MEPITPGDIPERWGRTLRQRRLQLNWRLVDVSRRSGLSVPTIRAMENGAGTVAFGKYALLAVMLDATELYAPTAIEPLTAARSAPENSPEPPQHSRLRARKKRRAP